MKKTTFMRRHRAILAVAAGLAGLLGAGGAGAATTPLADQPLAVADVPANVMLALSVEFPTAITRAHQGDTFDTSGNTKYLGYFDPLKCYKYPGDGGNYFQPVSFTTKSNAYKCSGARSGNFMNWATMQGIDTFRWVLTGGNRVIDTPTDFASYSATRATTVIERAYASKQGSYLTVNFPDRIISSTTVKNFTALGSPYDTGDVWIRNGGLGVQVRFGQVLVTTTTTTSRSGKTTTTTTTTNPWTLNAEGACVSGVACGLWNVRVEVCRDEAVGGGNLVTNEQCKQYTSAGGTKSVYKPVGLIQQYKDKMYFGAFGYLGLNSGDSATDALGTVNLYKDGGVLRAMLQSIDGEITETGAFKGDPYGLVDATQGINASGTINYLNKFGSLGSTDQRYKYRDPVSELYAEAIKYFKAMTPTASYVSGLNSAMRDGFPVFTTWNDPAKDAKYPTRGALSCKRNYILGIGDINSNYDFELSGAGSVGTPGPHNHATPADVDSNLAGKTTKAWTDDVGTAEGLSGLGTKVTLIGNNGSYQIAGLAYYAHSSDIRSDLDGIQTISTYWMDVLEGGYFDKNQYWLAAKYGGYVKPKGTSPGPFVNGTDVWNGNGRKDASGAALPDNYFEANSPDSMVSGLQSAFQSIAAGAGASAGAALSSPQINAATGGANTYQGTYEATNWSGDLIASKVGGLDLTSSTVDNPDLGLKTTVLWQAAAKLDAMDIANRKIVTLVPTDKTKLAPAPGDLKGAAFLWANLGDAQKLNLSKTAAVPAGDATDGQLVLSYLRGDRTNESTADTSKPYRQRGSRLGDIVDSKVVYLGKPNGSYSDSYNPGYTKFKADNATRTPLVLVGANDGMLHAFDASDTGGNEIFALVPYSGFAGPDGNPELSGIQALARKAYAHHYYMDATPEVRDVDFARTGAKLDSFGDSVTPDWRSLMVVGQGKGGRSFVAMDVTNLSSSLTEDAIAGKVLWEYTHADMGFSFGRPLIAKTRRWGWVVILSGGYNNIGGGKPGQGAIFVLNAKTGALLTSSADVGSGPVYTGFGSAASPAGLAQIEGYTPSYQDYTLEYVYGGDLYGNLWRFDFTSASADAPAVTKIAELTTSDGVGQPITTAPKIEYSADDLKRFVFVGTGRLLASEDLPNTQQHSTYAVRDGSKSKAYGTESYQISLPKGISFPVKRANMSQVTDLLAGATLDEGTPMGWYYDHTGKDASGATERVVLGLQANDGVLTWVGSVMNDDPCNAGGVANLYSVHYGSGQSVLYTLADGLRSPVKSQQIKGGLADIALVRIGSSIRVAGTDVKGGTRIYGSTVSDAGEPRVVNWRVIRE